MDYNMKIFFAFCLNSRLVYHREKRGQGNEKKNLQKCAWKYFKN